MQKIIMFLICLFFTPGLSRVCMAGDRGHQDCFEECGVEQREQRHVDSFKSIDIKGSFVLTITGGKNYSVEIIGDKSLLPHITTEVRNKTLMVYPKKPLCMTKEIRILISAPDIASLGASGSNIITMTGVNNPSVSVSLDGASNLKMAGNAKNFAAVLSGSSGLDAKNLRSEATHISIAGSSDATVFASDNLEATIRGIGHVIYYGNPKTVKKNISGIGEIKQAQ